jgi:hypothetical protein
VYGERKLTRPQIGATLNRWALPIVWFGFRFTCRYRAQPDRLVIMTAFDDGQPVCRNLKSCRVLPRHLSVDASGGVAINLNYNLKAFLFPWKPNNKTLSAKYPAIGLFLRRCGG